MLECTAAIHEVSKPITYIYGWMQYKDRWMSGYIPWLDDKDKRRNSTIMPSQVKLSSGEFCSHTFPPPKTFFNHTKINGIEYHISYPIFFLIGAPYLQGYVIDICAGRLEVSTWNRVDYEMIIYLVYRLLKVLSRQDNDKNNTERCLVSSHF